MPTATNSKENGPTTKKAPLAHTTIQMGTNMLEQLRMIRKADKEFSITTMEISTKDSGKTMKVKGKVVFDRLLGTYIYANGEKYEGDWKNGKMNGDGIISVKQHRCLYLF